MSKVAHYLQEHLDGEVTVSPDVRRHFSHDGSVLRLVPDVVVYPRSENDIRKTARFCWQLAERGKLVPITARGGGSDVSGAAIGSGIILAFTAHLNKILSLDTKKEIVELEPGINYDKLQQTLLTHGQFLPPYPTSIQFATVGGAVANNAVGEKSLKYGDTQKYVEGLRVVLANGEVIDTGRLTKKDLSRKMGLASMEGEIYRALDALIDENSELINNARKNIKSKHNSAGYNLFDVKRKDGSFDLTPLIVGSQGTLGIISEILLKTQPHNPTTTLAVASFNDMEILSSELPKIVELQPSMLEMVNRTALQQVSRINPNQLSQSSISLNAAATLFIEFDDFKEANQNKKLKKLTKQLEKHSISVTSVTELEQQDKLLKVREAVATLFNHQYGQAKAVPVAEDVAVPVESLAHFLQKAELIYEKHGLAATAWGHVGDGIVSMQPTLDLNQVGDRQKLFKLPEEIYNAALEFGGTITASSGDGRIKASHLPAMYGSDVVSLFEKVKLIFDPKGILNPGVKVGVDPEAIKQIIRSDFSHSHRHNYLPRT